MMILIILCFQHVLIFHFFILYLAIKIVGWFWLYTVVGFLTNTIYYFSISYRIMLSYIFSFNSYG